jgi:hypothetical protein
MQSDHKVNIKPWVAPTNSLGGTHKLDYRNKCPFESDTFCTHKIVGRHVNPFVGVY